MRPKRGHISTPVASVGSRGDVADALWARFLFLRPGAAPTELPPLHGTLVGYTARTRVPSPSVVQYQDRQPKECHAGPRPRS